MPLTEKDIVRIRQFIQQMESGLILGQQVFAAYHDSNLAAKPVDPTGDGTTGGWHREPTEASNWMSVKTALKDSAGTWGTPIRVFGLQGGADSAGVGQSEDVPKLIQIKFIGDGSSKVGWTPGTVEYGGTAYAIDVKAVGDGSTDAYIYWDDAAGQTSFKTTASLATAIAAHHHYVCRNDSGVATPAWIQRIILGGVIQAGTLNAAIVIISGTVTDTELSDGLNADIAQGIADALTAQGAADTAQADADTAQGAAEAAQGDADTGIADAASAQAELDDIAADTKVTPVEKLEAKQRWDAIVVEGTADTGTIPVQATAFGVADTDFDAAYLALDTYLNSTISVFDSPSTTTTIIRDDWDTAWKNYYDERTQLLNLIAYTAGTMAAAAQGDADTAQGAAEAAQADATTAIADAATAQETAEAAGGIKTFFEDAPPTAENAGDIWFDTDDGLKMHRATAAGDNEDKEGEWEHVNLTVIDGANLIGGSVLAAKIGTYALTAANATIENLFVKTAHIQNLHVTTEKIADDATHLYESALVSGYSSYYSIDTWYSIIQDAITSQGGLVNINLQTSFDNDSATGANINIEVKRGDAVIYSNTAYCPANDTVTLQYSFFDIPGAGAETYDFRAKADIHLCIRDFLKAIALDESLGK